LRLLSSLARTNPGKAALSRIAPAEDAADVQRLAAETAEASELSVRAGRLPLSGIEDVGPTLSLLTDTAGAASPEEFRPILTLARAASAVRGALRDVATPELGKRREALPDLTPILERARRLFAPEGGLKDDASPALASVRAKLRRRRNEVAANLEKILDARREILGDAVVVLRSDRYCLPVMASARGRLPGIVHDRSGSGQTVFVEPLEVIEANNDLALLASEERLETERLLKDFGLNVLAAREDFERALAVLSELDALEAKVAFAELSSGRLAEISEDGSWDLRAARHPLLDKRLAALRRRVLGEERAGKDAVPLDLALPAGKRLLVVSGPNAGGKTVVLKTAGLFALLARCGIPVPAAPGTRVPFCQPVRTEIGDAQTILADRSTFSSSMETLASIVEASSRGALALVDEIGGATDPEEGSALAVAWLEEYLARGGHAIVSTHLSAVKSFAAGREDAVLSAMEFDEETGRPTYRLRPGLSGRSRALSVAEMQRIPERVLARAREILGEAWQRRERMESEAEEALARLRQAEADLGEKRRRAVEEAEKLAAEREQMRRERGKLLVEGREAFERAKASLARNVEAELARIRQDSALLSQASSGRLMEHAEQSLPPEPVLAEAEALLAESGRDVSVGSRVRMRGLKAEGVVVEIDGDSAWLDVKGKRLRAPRSELEALAGPARPLARSPRRPIAASASADGPAPLTSVTHEVNVIGRRLEEAIEEVEKALDATLLAGDGRLRVIHGHGTGRLRDGLREHLRRHAAVESVRAAGAREGGNGATLVELK
jgi:DNA mismatch repair protein MutS2